MAVYVKISTASLRSFVYITGVDTKSPNALFLMRAIDEVWRANIKRFFSRHEYYYMKKPVQKYESIADIFHCEIRKGDIYGVIDSSNAKYINYLIYGAPPSSGAYVPSLGVRTSHGVWGGIPTIYWTTWVSFFRREVYSLIGQYGFDTRRRRGRRHPDINATRAAEVARVRRSVKSMVGTFYGVI